MSAKSALEEKFATVFATVCPKSPEPEPEYRFHPTRRWRFDFAWPKFLVAVELEGGVFIHGGHSRGKDFTDDCEKHNAAVMLGWRLLRYSTLDLRKRPVQCAEEVAKLLQTIQEVA